MKDIPVKIIIHEMSDVELKKIFGDKYHRLPEEIFKRLVFHPTTFEFEGYHVVIYFGMDNQTIVRSDRGVSLLRNNIVAPLPKSPKQKILSYTITLNMN